MDIRVQTAQVIGREHQRRGRNNQDAIAIINTDDRAIGVVCDGCGSSRYSEVGATLAAGYLVQRAATLHDHSHGIDQLVTLLYNDLLLMMENLLQTLEVRDRLRFIQDHLLFTVIGFVVTERDGMIFSAGDGVTVIDDSVCVIDQDNAPGYAAYHLVNPALLQGDVPPRRFEFQPIPNDWRRVAVATDGLDRDLVGQIWGHTHSRGLQRQFNVWSDVQHRLQDDTTVIAVERSR